jgi:hypothetical protein
MSQPEERQYIYQVMLSYGTFVKTDKKFDLENDADLAELKKLAFDRIVGFGEETILADSEGEYEDVTGEFAELLTSDE